MHDTLKDEGANLQHIEFGTAILFEPGQVVEVRVPRDKFGAITGYFDDHKKLAKAIKRLSDEGEYGGVYYTLNPCHGALLARREKNKLHYGMKDTTGDKDIIRRRSLLIDFDPERPAGVSATSAETHAAKKLMVKVLKALRRMGWPLPVVAFSGNGYHLLFRVDEPNDAETAQLFKQCLKAIAEQFGTAEVGIDTRVFNASRITKSYGSLAAKGLSTAERPHRYSKIKRKPAKLCSVSRAQLEALADTASTSKSPSAKIGKELATTANTTKSTSAKTGNPEQASPVPVERIEEFLKWAEIPVRSSGDYEGGTRWILEQCYFDPNHNRGEACVIQYPTGALKYSCLHQSCCEHGWTELRTAVEQAKGERFHFVERQEYSSSLPIGRNGEKGTNGNGIPTVCQSLKELRKKIEMLLYASRKNNSALPPIAQAPSIITDIIWNDLSLRGKFFRDSSRDFAYLSLPGKESETDIPKVLEISDNCWFEAMLDQYYGIQIAEPVAHRITAQLENRTMTAKGQKHNVHELGQYDREKNELFVCFGDEVLLIRADGMEVVQNGHDNRFFVVSQRYTTVDARAVMEAALEMKGWTAGLDISHETPLTEYLFKNVPFEKGGALTPEQARQVVFAGLLSLPFGDAIAEKPVFYSIGDEDSGKTHLNRKVGYLLYGTSWDVVSLGEEQRDFTTALVRNYLLCVDDIEEDSREAKANAKKLCRCATGGYVSFRVMRSDAQEKKLPFTAWVWISGLSLFNHAPDFLSRLITIGFRGELPKERQGRGELQQFVTQNRVGLLAEFVNRLQLILQGIESYGGSGHGIRFRMADWVKIIAPAKNEGLLEDFIELFDAVKGERMMDAENDPLMKPIRMMFAEKAGLNGTEMRLDVLESQLKAIAEEHGFKAHCLTDIHTASTWALSRNLTKLAKVLLRKKYGFKDKKARPHGETHKVRYVTFNLSEQVMNEVKQWAAECKAARRPDFAMMDE